MKKFLALLLSVVMVLALAACGEKAPENTNEPAPAAPTDTTPAAPADTTPADTTPAAPEASDMRVAMITDYGDITDQSFNQTTYEAAKSWSEDNGADFTYFKPASDSDDDRVAMIEKAIDEGYTVIVMPGFAFAPAIAATVGEYPDVTFIALDVSEFDLNSAGLATLPANLYSAVYQEELCGYMAGYAAVKLGYTKLGFLGGMAVPAVVRYGYGFVQGADAAAAADGKTDVSIKYAYGNQFYGDGDITAAMDTWYAAGTEVVFACGGGIYDSAAEAAAKVGAKVIGVDVDQAGIIDGKYGAGMTVTSAMKGLAATVNTLLTQVKDGSFVGGVVDNLGLVSADPESNFVQIPMNSTQWADTFTQDDYKALVSDMFSGAITVSNDIDKNAADFATVISVEDLGNIK
ncbi:MAG: BMP family ABC transporter substrate-binding protein [Ruminococcaceae bacterium]|jgi:basic membrane protein A|nr:BMP family ABC transporter substrate-binding protein [Oscillospiraceae bacterium]